MSMAPTSVPRLPRRFSQALDTMFAMVSAAAGAAVKTPANATSCCLAVVLAMSLVLVMSLKTTAAMVVVLLTTAPQVVVAVVVVDVLVALMLMSRPPMSWQKMRPMARLEIRLMTKL